MILGLGTDILDIHRFEGTLKTYNQQVLNRLFTAQEQAYCDAKPHFRTARYAKRFAAKEAALKALGTGRSKGIRWQDVSVVNDETGKPSLKFCGRAREILQEKAQGQVVTTHLSLSDSEAFATATVIIEVCPS